MRQIIILLAVFTSFLTTAQTVEQLGSAINTEFSELNPVLSPDGKTLYFARVSHPSNTFGTKHSQDVWYAELRDNNNWTIARRMPNTINKDQYNDLFSITPDGNKILISGVYTNNGRREDAAGISVCKRTKTGWSEPEQVVIPRFNEMCKGQFLTACLSNDGKTLIMAFSTKKNSKQDDLYVSFLGKDGKWSKPEGLGPDINTDDIETAPFLASDNYTLYFASDRKNGFGGTDIWVSKRLDRSWQRWSKPKNMGDKINTDANEYSFSVSASGEYAYMSTKKNSVGKNDIVRFKLREDKKETPVVAGTQTSDSKNTGQNTANGKTTTDETSIAPNPVVIVSGRVLDSQTGKPIEAKITYKGLSNGESGEAYTNPVTGIYTIVLPYGAKYTYTAEAENFIGIEKLIDLTEIGSYKEKTNDDLKIAPIKANVDVPLNNVFFETGKAVLRSDSYPELDKIVDILLKNASLVIEIQGHTDNVGSNESNQKLSQDRAEAVRKYLLSKKVQNERVTSIGYGEMRPVATNDTEEGRAQNRRVQLSIVRN